MSESARDVNTAMQLERMRELGLRDGESEFDLPPDGIPHDEVCRDIHDYMLLFPLAWVRLV
jgi:hypothetical protein